MPVVVVAGASGVVGRHLVRQALIEGYEVRTLGRSPAAEATTPPTVTHHVWDPARAGADPGSEDALPPIQAALEGADLVVNLAGASLAEGRLDREHKRRVLESRLCATRALVRAHARCDSAPPVWLNASATGYYGDTGEADVDEASPRGGGFLAAVCERWEEAARPVEARARLILPRLGLVLAADAPAWKKLLLPIVFGLGGPLGSGRQWWAWIDAQDLARALLWLSRQQEASGPINLTTPDPVRQADLSWQTAMLVNRPAMFPTPESLLRLAIGEVADALLLPSCRAMPTHLQQLGFAYERPLIGQELLAILGLPAHAVRVGAVGSR